MSNWFATPIPNQTITKPLGSFLRLIAGTVRDTVSRYVYIDRTAGADEDED